MKININSNDVELDEEALARILHELHQNDLPEHLRTNWEHPLTSNSYYYKKAAAISREWKSWLKVSHNHASHTNRGVDK